MIEITSLGQLLALVNSNDHVTVVDFYADWCGPCQAVKPEYERVAQYYDANQVHFCECNVDRNRDCASRYQVQGIPTFIVFHHSQIVFRSSGANLGPVQRNIDLALERLITERQQTAAAHPASSAAAVGQISDDAPAVKAIAAHMVAIAAAVREKDMIQEKAHCDAVFKLLTVAAQADPLNDTTGPAAALLLPYLASSVYASAALEALLKNISLRSAPDNLEGHTLITQILRFVVEVAAASTWHELPVLSALARAVLALAQCPRAQPLLTQSAYFSGPLCMTGFQFERLTVLGALLGAGPEPRTSYQTIQQRSLIEWGLLQDVFPAAAADQNAQRIYSVQRCVEQLAQVNCQLVQGLLRTKGTRDATLWSLGQALKLNEAYQKTRHENDPLSSRFFMAQLQAVLVEAAAPIFAKDARGAAAQIPTTYLLDDARNPVVVTFGAEVERIAYYSAANPLPAVPDAVALEGYKATTHLFFLAVRAITLCACTFIDAYDVAERNSTHPAVPQRERGLYLAEKCLYASLTKSNELASRRVQFLDNVALWLLNVMRVNEQGVLPQAPPAEWMYLPQQLVDCVIRGTKLAPVEALFTQHLISLMLVLMGNTVYFPKAHTHALFPAYLIRLLNDATTRRSLENHPWFSTRIIRACMDCYIAVESSYYEKVEVRYQLSHCIKQFLQVNSLCMPLKREFNQEGSSASTELEQYSHMAAADVNESVDQIIQSLTKMHDMMKAGVDMSVNATPAAAAGGNDDNNNNPAVGPSTRQSARQRGGRAAGATANANEESGNDGEEEEENDSTDTQTYHQIGQGLRSHIQLFEALMDMFIELSKQFRRGISQNRVAQQISQMLSRSLVAFAGPKNKTLRIEYADRYDFKPRDILARLVDCITHFRRTPNFMRCLCDNALPDLLAAMNSIVQRQLVGATLCDRLAEMASALESLSKEVQSEETFWADAPDFALDALLSEPLTDPVALPAENLEDLDNLVYVNAGTIHHHLLSSKKNPFTNEPLDTDVLRAFNARPDVTAHREKLKQSIHDWVDEQRRNATLES